MLFAYLRIDSRATAGKNRRRCNRAIWSVRTASFCTIEAAIRDTIAKKNFATPSAVVRARSDDTPKAVMARKQRHQNGDICRHDCIEAAQLANLILEEVVLGRL
jgi:hypothetical protein